MLKNLKGNDGQNDWIDREYQQSDENHKTQIEIQELKINT